MASIRTVAAGCLIASVSLLGCDARPDTGPDDRAPERSLPSLIAPTRPSTYTAWAGPGCTTDTTYREQGRFANGDAAWFTVPSGGFRGGGCDGRFTALPMSGSPDRDGPSTATWTWPVGTDYERCALAVFVPQGPRDIDVAGNPTVYRVLADPDDPTSTYAAFGVRQPLHRGTLVQVGTYPVKSPTFTVHLTNRGLDWGTPTLTGAHHAAAQLRLTCRA